MKYILGSFLFNTIVFLIFLFDTLCCVEYNNMSVGNKNRQVEIKFY